MLSVGLLTCRSITHLQGNIDMNLDPPLVSKGMLWF